MTNYKDAKYNFSGAGLTAIPTSAVSSGTFADARFAASNVTQHITTYDDKKVKDDISTLALKSAIADNKAAHNLTNAFIEQFQDDTGLDDETQGDRNASEYWGTGVSETIGYGDSIAMTIVNVIHAYGGTATATLQDNDLTPSNYSTYYSNPDDQASPPRYGWTQFDMTLPVTITRAEFYKRYTGTTSMLGVPKIVELHKSDDNSSWTTLTPASAVNGSISGDVLTTVDDEDWSGFNISATTARYWRFQMGDGWDHGGANHAISEVRFVGSSYNHATGSFTCNNQTANATVSKGGIIVLYKNEAGTATLNTDLVAKISANGGTNYETVTLTALGTFSTGILMASAQNVTISNTGTSMKYQIAFANQVIGSKETQVHGVALLY
jgi:hypothetical protein